MDPAGQIPAEPLPVHLSAIRRHFEISLYFLLLTGVLTLVSTGKLDLVTILVLPAAMLFKGYRWWHGKGPEISNRVGHLADGRLLYFLPVRSLDHFAHAGGRRAESGPLRGLARDDSPDAVRHRSCGCTAPRPLGITCS